MSFHERRILVCLSMCVRSRLRRSGAEGWAASTRHRQGPPRRISLNLGPDSFRKYPFPFVLAPFRSTATPPPSPTPRTTTQGQKNVLGTFRFQPNPASLLGASHPAIVGRNDLWMVFATLTCPSVCWCFSSCAAGRALSVRILAA